MNSSNAVYFNSEADAQGQDKIITKQKPLRAYIIILHELKKIELNITLLIQNHRNKCSTISQLFTDIF